MATFRFMWFIQKGGILWTKWFCIYGAPTLDGKSSRFMNIEVVIVNAIMISSPFIDSNIVR